ncbi:MAG: hypothetical protein ACYS47_02350 [Planctomycetota bacterium]|jgi:hypothetical protein
MNKEDKKTRRLGKRLRYLTGRRSSCRVVNPEDTVDLGSFMVEPKPAGEAETFHDRLAKHRKTRREWSPLSLVLLMIFLAVVLFVLSCLLLFPYQSLRALKSAWGLG